MNNGLYVPLNTEVWNSKRKIWTLIGGYLVLLEKNLLEYTLFSSKGVTYYQEQDTEFRNGNFRFQGEGKLVKIY